MPAAPVPRPDGRRAGPDERPCGHPLPGRAPVTPRRCEPSHPRSDRIRQKCRGLVAPPPLPVGDRCPVQTFCKRTVGRRGTPEDTNTRSRCGKPQVDRIGGHARKPEDTYEVGLLIRRLWVRVPPSELRNPQVDGAIHRRFGRSRFADPQGVRSMQPIRRPEPMSPRSR
jgi:hypothetical protein